MVTQSKGGNAAEFGAAEIFLQAAAINYARWHEAYSASFHNLPADKLGECVRAGDEARLQLREAARRCFGRLADHENGVGVPGERKP
jgi:hypothetical protein